MQIVPFPAYYQSVYTNFDFTSFSLISWGCVYAVIARRLRRNGKNFKGCEESNNLIFSKLAYKNGVLLFVWKMQRFANKQI